MDKQWRPPGNPYRTTDGTHRFAKKPIAPTAVEAHMRKIREALHNQQLSLEEEMEIIAELRDVLPQRKVWGTFDPDGPFHTVGTGNGGYLK
jgi:hypothetical protein